MKKHIFLFTLSPVQSFIAQARKTQDLYAGSRILSELTKTAAIEATKNQGINLVFPKNTEGVASFPNRFIGIINDDSKDLQTIGHAIEKVVIDTFKGFANDALKKVHYQNDVPNGFKEQIDNHLDINWLFQPIDEKNGGYEKAYQEAESIMGALKNVRIIENDFVEAGRKCSLDGELNALFFGKGTNPNYLRTNKAKIVEQGARLNANEGLSAISLVKRTYEAQKFPSTAAVSLSFHIEHLDVVQKINYGIYKSFFSDRFDEQLCYKENLTQKYLEQNGYKDILDKCSLAKLQELRSNAFGDKELQKYYAIIAFDGDKMGELLSGERCKTKPTNLADFQGMVSQLLRDFADSVTNEEAKNYVWEGNVKPHVIYAGGDDFLGFVNLHDLFEVVETLRIQFDEQVNKALKEDLETDKPFTFSMGIALAHYKTPLSIVLKTARDMEKLAKQEDKGNRDAFAIAALKHSGDSHEAYFNWELTTDNKLPKWNAFKELVKSFQDDCSETFVRSLDREFYYLQNSDGDIANPKMVETELFRLAAKSLHEGKKDKDALKLKDTVWTFFKKEDKTTHESIAAGNGMEAVKVALFLKRETKKDKENGHQN